MANKQVKDLKKGDKIRSSVSDGQRVYLGMCLITDISKSIPIYDPNGLRGADDRIELRKVNYIAQTGKLQGMKFGFYIPDNEFVIVPDRPNRFFRAIAELWSA